MATCDNCRRAEQHCWYERAREGRQDLEIEIDRCGSLKCCFVVCLFFYFISQSVVRGCYGPLLLPPPTAEADESPHHRLPPPHRLHASLHSLRGQIDEKPTMSNRKA